MTIRSIVFQLYFNNVIFLNINSYSTRMQNWENDLSIWQFLKISKHQMASKQRDLSEEVLKLITYKWWSFHNVDICTSSIFSSTSQNKFIKIAIDHFEKIYIPLWKNYYFLPKGSDNPGCTKNTGWALPQNNAWP